jgi:hypothetical protein
VEEAKSQQIKALHERGLTPGQYEADTLDFIRRGTENHLALDKPVTLAAPASEKYPVGGAAALTDGIRGPNDYHCNWAGFEAQPFGATVDLEEVRSVKRVSLDFLHDESAWIFLPHEVEVELSRDGSAWTKAGSIPRKAEGRRDRSFIESYDCRFETQPARYVRVTARHHLTCPDWHKGAGGKAWVFCDEIVVQ